MKTKRKYSKSQVAAAVCCGIGCLFFMLAASLGDPYKKELFSVGLALNGIGLFVFLFGKKSGKSV